MLLMIVSKFTTVEGIVRMEQIHGFYSPRWQMKIIILWKTHRASAVFLAPEPPFFMYSARIVPED